jgi:hypothetical protein
VFIEFDRTSGMTTSPRPLSEFQARRTAMRLFVDQMIDD